MIGGLWVDLYTVRAALVSKGALRLTEWKERLKRWVEGCIAFQRWKRQAWCGPMQQVSNSHTQSSEKLEEAGYVPGGSFQGRVSSSVLWIMSLPSLASIALRSNPPSICSRAVLCSASLTGSQARRQTKAPPKTYMILIVDRWLDFSDRDQVGVFFPAHKLLFLGVVGSRTFEQACAFGGPGPGT